MGLAAESKLHDFVRQAWHVLEPETPFVDGWHIGAICTHLEACTSGEIHRLLINVPPRTTKSLVASVMWPAWLWISRPSLRLVCASYADSLATRDSIKTRDLIQSEWYQEFWSDRFKLKGDVNRVTRFENSKTGFRLATSVGGMSTGEGGDIIIVDDPHNAKDAYGTRSKMHEAIRWWRASMSTRLNNADKGVRVICMQRLHEGDLSGYVLSEQEGYTHLMLPMEYDPARHCVTSIGWEDPRKYNGESLLCEKRFSKSAVERLKSELGSEASGQLQQLTAPESGLMFNSSLFKFFAMRWVETEGVHEPYFVYDRSATSRVSVRASDCVWFQTVDTAFKTGEENDYTAVGTFAATPLGDLLVVDMARDRIEVPKQFDFVVSQQAKWPLVSYQAVEDQASGQWLIQAARSAGKPFRVLKADQDKQRRAILASIYAQNGMLYFLAGAPWYAALESELRFFPRGLHDDQVDVLAYAAHEAKRGMPGVRVDPAEYESRGDAVAAASQVAIVQAIEAIGPPPEPIEPPPIEDGW